MTQSPRLFTTPKWVVECNHTGACPVSYECDGLDGLDTQRPTASGIRGPCIGDAATNSPRRSQPLVFAIRGLLLTYLPRLARPAVRCSFVMEKEKRGAQRLTGGFRTSISALVGADLSGCASVHARLRATLHHNSKAKQDLQPRVARSASCLHARQPGDLPARNATYRVSADGCLSSPTSSTTSSPQPVGRRGLSNQKATESEAGQYRHMWGLLIRLVRRLCGVG